MVCDLRTISFDVPPQEILTKDSVTVAVDAVIYYKINSPMVEFMTCLHEFSEYESTNFFYQICNICSDFPKRSKLRENAFFWPIRNYLFFSTTYNYVVEKIRSFVFGKFVKACRELDNSQPFVMSAIMPKAPNCWPLPRSEQYWELKIFRKSYRIVKILQKTSWATWVNSYF